MPFNGTGTFNRVYNWVQDKANAIFVTASRMDTEMDGMATGLSTCLTKDGQTTPTANIPMGGRKITGLATGVDPTDAVNVAQVPTLAGAGVFFNAGNTGVALSIDWANGLMQKFTLTDNTTITLGNGINPGWYTLQIIQDGTGGRSIAWTGGGYVANRWVGNTIAPSFPATANGVNYVYLFWDGSGWWQVYLGAAARRKTYFTRAYSSFLATTAGVATKVPFDTAPVDPYTEWASNRWTPESPGLYLVQTQGQFTNASADQIILQIYVGGVAVSEEFTVIPAGVYRPLSTHTLLNITLATLSTNYVEAFFTSVTGAGGMSANAATNFITITRLGDAE